jgi:hypothetical protein
MTELREVALLALLYRENYIARRTGLDSIGQDQEVCPGELSWLTMIGADALTEYDWAIINDLDQPSDFSRLARIVDPLRAEALLHAVPPNGRCSRKPWAEPYRARWGQVRSRMRLFEQEGYTATRDDLDSLAARAWMAATGDTFEQYANAWL